MNNSIQTLSFIKILIAFIPVLLVMGILIKWSLKIKTSIHAVLRMLSQLLIIGYFLTTIFESNNPWIVMAIFLLMIITSSWISLRTIKKERKKLYKNAFIAILIGGGFTLFIVSQKVLDLTPWYSPRYIIPLAGMIFANCMNSVSLAAERFHAESVHHLDYLKSRKIAFKAALIPSVNSLFAVGLVSIPGMMTGQILSGISPIIAARYQIMVMCMVFGSAGLSAACYLYLLKPKK
ncbi:MAG: ABC transporter permease [bacterium]|nr:ABC transporter permease [bacterium]